MSKKINNSEIKSLGYTDERALKEAGWLARTYYRNHHEWRGNKQKIYEFLAAIYAEPEQFLQHEDAYKVAFELVEWKKELGKTLPTPQNFTLREQPLPYNIYGANGIEEGALRQMNNAMKLPVAVAGALMPDAHQGYGLPIGGVLATPANIVIPYAVGVDIACRMCLSIFDIEATYYMDNKQHLLEGFLQENTLFGIDGHFKQPLQDDLFDQEEWRATKLIRHLREKAIRQVGTSGTGNHFVEFGVLEVQEPTADIPLPQGKYLALLSHSGSRGFGATIAGHYSKLAMELTELPKEAQHLAWLDLNTEEGMEYWIAMNLAGEYASTNHHHIHKRMAKSLGVKPVLMIENHHNFAWKETLADGTPVIVHRKGATPASETDLGIIPGTMASPAFVVRGKGNPNSLNSASHGAGRLMSRTKAFDTFTKQDVKKVLNEKGITLFGGDLDEAPMVYKDIYEVMKAQEELVSILAKFHPKIVRMADADRKQPRED
jgi:tRNA-splicing ligase RtcB